MPPMCCQKLLPLGYTLGYDEAADVDREDVGFGLKAGCFLREEEGRRRGHALGGKKICRERMKRMQMY